MAFLMRLFIVLLAFLLAATPADAGKLELYEQEIKAGLLYNFLKYTQWPEGKKTSDPSSVTVCIYGSDPFNGYLQPMAGRTVNQKSISLRRISKTTEIGDCHLLFLNADVKEEWSKVRAWASSQNVLTVSDYAGFAGEGGMIEFGKKGDHISVALNMAAVNHAKLQVQNRLLKLVTVVDGGAQ